MRRGMNLEEAMEILDVVQGEDKAKIRKKYRSLMRRYHPGRSGIGPAGTDQAGAADE